MGGKGGAMGKKMDDLIERAKATFRGEYVRWRQIEKTHLNATNAQNRAWAAVIAELRADWLGTLSKS